ncbi:DWNN-domain-containing protein [Sodiomyces alkalinus F11]|uniref:DWNN-domain-containing protein n=1 Tax=Sodiomyces alkalinus (strain CBS 110278 / VKM F-3762 / F11) TaxID=1314773 RepID=A0A3N2Q528_SODAK|nr:DWNN-domain-containing protein [Sodiomyces alkalinus F11]ROT41758.1 DWNN-domain-containing protein [Sodiomyces alkalinus F11]
MSSSVFFKFKSQKEPTRVEFDGTGISVFELKRDIILKSGLGDGTDFDLAIYTEDGSEEYDDDTTIIPRSTTVVARRLPAAKPGAGRGARYVLGKMPVSAKNSARKEQTIKPIAAKPSTNALAQMSSAMTEDEKMAAMFAAQSEQWSAQQEEMSHQTPVFNKGGAKRPANVPDHDPPNGYICYRCGEKGHWIQLCPTNDDPEFDNRPRVKRTTGIPRSFLRTVDKSVALAQNGDDDSKRPSGIMVNAEGEFVIAEPDKASWEQFQAKAKSSASAAKAIAMGDKDVQERGLACPIDKKMFIEPMKTPCCQKTYCNDCITNALIESDFVCPNCNTDSVLIDDLKPDDEAVKKMNDYLKEKIELENPTTTTPNAGASSPTPLVKDAPQGKTEKSPQASQLLQTDKEKASSKPPTPAVAKVSPKATPAHTTPPKSAAATPTQAPTEGAPSTEANAKKRPADDLLENPKIPKAPKAMQRQQEQQHQQQAMLNGPGAFGMPMNPMMGFGGFGGMNMNMGNFPMGMPNMGGMNMGMPMMNGMNPMMGMPGFNPMQGGFPPDMNGNAMFNGNFNMNGGGMNGMNGMQGLPGGPMNGYDNQQRHNFTQPSNDDDAYFRRPVNPHRHQNRQRRVPRPSDYREL